MRAVLGIDAAWTAAQPSGMALAIETADRWRLAAIAPSYGAFMGLAEGRPAAGMRPEGSVPDPLALLRAAEAIGGRPIDLVAVDMPLARTPITARRAADDAVSRAYGGRKCATHSPSAVRPGRIADHLRAGFEAAGYLLCTQAIRTPGLIEVYPHPALVELARSRARLPYKAGKTASYWRGVPLAERRERLLDQWRAIVTLLDGVIAGVAPALPACGSGASGADLKAHEDMIDAAVCAWVGVTALDGRAVPHGDHEAAIWIPAPAHPAAGSAGCR